MESTPESNSITATISSGDLYKRKEGLEDIFKSVCAAKKEILTELYGKPLDQEESGGIEDSLAKILSSQESLLDGNSIVVLPPREGETSFYTLEFIKGNGVDIELTGFFADDAGMPQRADEDGTLGGETDEPKIDPRVIMTLNKDGEKEIKKTYSTFNQDTVDENGIGLSFMEKREILESKFREAQESLEEKTGLGKEELEALYRMRFENPDRPGEEVDGYYPAHDFSRGTSDFRETDRDAIRVIRRMSEDTKIIIKADGLGDYKQEIEANVRELNLDHEAVFPEEDQDESIRLRTTAFALRDLIDYFKLKSEISGYKVFDKLYGITSETNQKLSMKDKLLFRMLSNMILPRCYRMKYPIGASSDQPEYRVSFKKVQESLNVVARIKIITRMLSM